MISRKIPRGLDFLTTVRAQQWIELPAEMLGPNMEPFREMVVFIGAQLDPPVGNADTVMERLEAGEIGAKIPTRLAAFANVSAAPIELVGTGPLAGFYDLYVTLSPTAESPGTTVYESSDGISGTFTSEVSLSPLFELRPLGGGKSIFVDTGETPLPGFPMRLGSTDGAWSRRSPLKNAARHFSGQTLFYTSGVLITARRGDDGQTIAACAKQQAELPDALIAGRFSRIDFPFTRRPDPFEYA